MRAVRSVVALAFLLLATLASGVAGQGFRYPPLFPPTNAVPHCADPTIQNRSLYYTLLEASTQMPAQVVSLRVGVPFFSLVEWFDQASEWTSWNHLFSQNGVTNYSLCAPFNNVSYTNAPPVSPPFPKGMTAPHFIDQHGFNSDMSEFAFGWGFQLLAEDGTQLVFGRHTFTIRPYVDESGVPASIVTHFEKAAGAQLDTKVNQRAWTKALQESLLDTVNGFVCLERVFVANGNLTADAVRAECHPFQP